MTTADPSRLRVFLCHDTADKPAIRRLYRRLAEDGFDPWLDEKSLVPGQTWSEVIEKQVRASDAFVVCLSEGSVRKEGFVQRELKQALDVSREKPTGVIFVIPVRLEPVELPEELKKFHWANLYEPDGYGRLVEALKARAAEIGRQSPRRTKGQKFQSWMVTHPVSIAIVLVAMLSLMLTFTFKLYRAQQQKRVDAVRLNEEAIQKLRSFSPGQAKDLLLVAVTDDSSNARLRANLAVTYGELGDYIQAQIEARKASGLLNGVSDRDRSWVTGVEHEMNWRLKDAASSYSDAWNKYGDPEAGLRLARAQVLSGYGRAAFETLKKLRDKQSGTVDPRIDYEVALAANSLDDFKQEIETLEGIVQDNPNENLILATALSQKCWALYKSDKPEDAGKDCGSAYSKFQVAGDQLGIARTLTRQSLILAQKDPISAEAMRLQDQALVIVQKLHAQLDEAGALQNRANLLVNLNKPGETEKAGKDYDTATKIYESIGNQRAAVDLRNDAATRLVAICDYEKASTEFGRAKLTYSSMADKQGLAIAGSNVANMLYPLGNLADAESNMTDALKLADSTNLQLDRANWLITLGEVYMSQGKLAEAERCFRSQKCYEKPDSAKVETGQDPVLLDALPDFILLQIEQKEIAEAVQGARAQVLKNKGKDPDDEATALDVLARALIAQGGRSGLNEAKAAVAKANSLGFHGCTLRLSLTITGARSSANLGQFEEARGELTNALKQADEKFMGYKFESLLALAETDFLAGKLEAAEGQAAKVSSTAGTAGYVLIKAKADQLIVKIKSKQAHKGS
jgi:tetratricopeptide (TPR) repeat protein